MFVVNYMPLKNSVHGLRHLVFFMRVCCISLFCFSIFSCFCRICLFICSAIAFFTSNLSMRFKELKFSISILRNCCAWVSSRAQCDSSGTSNIRSLFIAAADRVLEGFQFFSTSLLQSCLTFVRILFLAPSILSNLKWKCVEGRGAGGEEVSEITTYC